MKIAKIQTFDSNTEWLRTVETLDGNRAFTDEQIDEMTEAEATKIAKDIMTE